MTRAEVVAIARSLLVKRVKFRPYGRSPEYGLDCLGVVIWTGREAGLLPPEQVKPIPPYAFPPSTENFELLKDFLVPVEEISPASVVVFTATDMLPRHVGFVSHRGASGAWRLIGSIPGSLAIGEFGLLFGLSNHIYAIYDYPDIA